MQDPFKPTAGATPPELVGRAGPLDEFEYGLQQGSACRALVHHHGLQGHRPDGHVERSGRHRPELRVGRDLPNSHAKLPRRGRRRISRLLPNGSPKTLPGEARTPEHSLVSEQPARHHRIRTRAPLISTSVTLTRSSGVLLGQWKTK
jgi:hypothetical protein